MSITKAAVVGAGFMGGSIALVCAQSGIRTVCMDISAAQADKARADAQRVIAGLVEKGKINAQDGADALARLTHTSRMDDIAEAEAVIEAVPEDMELKIRTFRQIEKAVSPNALILSNTSGLSISRIAEGAANPGRIMCAHFCSPPAVMKLVELIRARQTTGETFVRTLDFVRQLGKEPVEAPELPGFILNRVLIPMINEAIFLVAQGARKEDVDQAMKLGANHRMGPLELGDFIGLDVVLAIMRNFHQEFSDDKYRPCPLLEEMVSRGELGRKTKKGFYAY